MHFRSTQQTTATVATSKAHLACILWAHLRASFPGLYGKPDATECQAPCSNEHALTYYNTITGDTDRERQCQNDGARGKKKGKLTGSQQKALQTCMMPCGKKWTKTGSHRRCKAHFPCCAPCPHLTPFPARHLVTVPSKLVSIADLSQRKRPRQSQKDGGSTW